MKECDALLICVPNPMDKFRKPDMSYIESACIAIGQNMKPGTFISLESTTYPTTTENLMLPLIEEASKQNFVLHKAALGSVPRSINDPITTNEVNVGGFLNMLVAA